MFNKTLISMIAGLALVGSVQAADKSGADVYKAACAACHNTGAAGAPKNGNKAAWAKRNEQGLDVLIKSAIKGKKAMPAKGGKATLSDMEVARAVVFLANAGGGTFQEPSATDIAAALK